MLPTKGYFQDIECPYYNSVCNRPYCHFRHRKKGLEPPEIQLEPEIEVPTYKPTPKSELANIKSHIPISYVPDLAFRPNNSRPRPLPFKINEKPTYKPTPLSILSSANTRGGSLSDDKEETTETIQVIKEIKQNIANVEYKPEISLQTTVDINFEELSAEFDLIDDIIDNSTTKVNDKEEIPKKKTHKDENKSSKSSKRSSSKSHKEKHHKSDTKEKSKDDKKKHKSKERSKDKKHHKSSSKDKKKEKRRKSVESSVEDDFNNIELEEDEDETMLECYKIFNEYKPPETEVKTVKEPEVNEKETPIFTGKKRISHVNEASRDNVPKEVKKLKVLPSPAQVMANRFKLIREQQANNEEKCIKNEVKQSVSLKRPPPSLLEAARTYKQLKTTKSTNLVESIINDNKMKAKRIIPAQNVSLIQKAKAKIDEITKQNVAPPNKTVVHNKKNEKRIAHIPDFSLSNIPDVINADKSKLPINVRTRFLTMIADECVKLYLNKEDAYTRALNEEFQCYEKCKVLITYKNSAMLSVSRLRKEFQERDKLGLGLYESGESSNKDKSSQFKGIQFYNNIKDYLLSEDELDIHGFPKESTIPGRAIIKNPRNKPTLNLDENERKCSRCSKIYLVDVEGFPLYQEECIYHPLKKRTLRGEQTYLCCKSNDDTGCATSKTHVCEMSEQYELEGYQTTMPPENETDPRNCAVYALDCEMCYTVKGLELTRVTIVDSECKIIYESLVKPLNPIIDYNTNFSGITKEQMDKTSTSILQVQANILHLCNSKTILIGHSLESDMKALKIIHGTIIDTSVLFPHKMGLPHKRALKMLASEFLKKIIQNSINGHDSAEDAITCMDLVKWKLKEELKVRGIK